MRKRNSRSNKLIPIIVLAAIVGGGYYWFSSDYTIVKKDQLGDTHSSAILEKGQVGDAAIEATETSELDLVEDTLTEGEDTLGQQAYLDQESAQNQALDRNPYQNTDRDTIIHSAPQKAKDAYVDKYGNVIYTHPEKIRYQTYVQSRWGYKIKYPTYLTREIHSQNNDGVTLDDGRGSKLITFGSWNIFKENISDLYQKKVSNAKTVTYKRLFRKQNSYVKSGYTKDGHIFYMKEALIGKGDSQVIVTLVFTYPKSQASKINPIINEIFGNFPTVVR